VRNIADVTAGKPSAAYSQSFAAVSVANPFVAIYNIHWAKGFLLFFFFVLVITPYYIAALGYVGLRKRLHRIQ
jgi:hypothetical protein